MLSSPTMHTADRSFTTSVIILGCSGSMALANRERLLSSLIILSKPYYKHFGNKRLNVSSLLKKLTTP